MNDESNLFSSNQNCEEPKSKEYLAIQKEVASFAAWMREYVIGVAKKLGERFHIGGELHESGYFILAGLTSYFEGVGQHIIGSGYEKRGGKSLNREYAVTLLEIFGAALNNDEETAKEFKNCVRNGLAHDGAVRNRVELSRHFNSPIETIRDKQSKIIGFKINPHLVAKEVDMHFTRYIAKLQSGRPEYHEMRQNFAKRRDEIDRFSVADSNTNSTTSTSCTPSPNFSEFQRPTQ